LPEFVDTAISEIDERLRALKDEAARLEAARAALTGTTGRRGRPASNGTRLTRQRSASRRDGHTARPTSRRNGNSRADQTLELVRARPGVTIPEIAQAMKIQPNYLYRVLPRLAAAGEVKRDGQGWHPVSPSTPTAATPTRQVRSRAKARSTKSEPTASTTPTASTPRSAEARSTGGRTARGQTRASVLAALAGGEAMTAGEVATKAGLSRPTVSTTLSKLAKSGEVQKAERGYRVVSAS
jgi:DNA-binding MarR family transcriptional regulator